jgi:hypothetical protein
MNPPRCGRGSFVKIFAVNAGGGGVDSLDVFPDRYGRGRESTAVGGRLGDLVSRQADHLTVQLEDAGAAVCGGFL